MADKDEKLRESVATMRYIEGQMAGIQQQLGNFEHALVEIATTKTALEAMKKMDKDTASLMPLGSGVFAHGILHKQEKLLVDVGSGIIVEKNIEETQKLLDQREQDISNNAKTFQQAAASLEKQYAEVGEKARELSK